jgi:hypothetical protein
VDWWIQGYSFTTEMRVLDLQAYDAILGFDWLSSHSPITHHWDNKTMEFSHQGTTIRLCGVQSGAQKLDSMPMERMVKWWSGNDIWAMADILPDADSGDSVPVQVQQLLEEYQDVFATPRGLPPNRQYDHSIPTLPDAVPINSRPYRYSPLHKDEIEKQVRELLSAGLITPSTSPYASPVLLAQKRMALGVFVWTIGNSMISPLKIGSLSQL